MITVKLYGPLRRGAREVRLEGEGPTTVGRALAALGRRCPALVPLLWEGPERLRPHVAVLVDGRNVHALDGLDTPVAPGSTLTVLSPIEGG